jgi:hypothetical protein
MQFDYPAFVAWERALLCIWFPGAGVLAILSYLTRRIAK